MTIHGMHSKASIKGHPIHAMLVGFPIAMYTGGLAAVIAYLATHDAFWFRAAMISWFVGVGMAALAAVFGAIDLFFGVPRSERGTRRTGVMHMGINIGTLVLFAAGAFSLLASWRKPIDETSLSVGLPMLLGIVGLALTGVAGALGWKLVQTHHVGVGDTAEEPDRGHAVQRA